MNNFDEIGWYCQEVYGSQNIYYADEEEKFTLWFYPRGLTEKGTDAYKKFMDKKDLINTLRIEYVGSSGLNPAKDANAIAKVKIKDTKINSTVKKPKLSLSTVGVPQGVQTGYGYIDFPIDCITQNTDIVSKEPTKYSCSIEDYDMFKVEVNNSKTQTIKTVVTDEAWTDSVDVSGKFNVVKAPEIVLSNPKITLNMDTNYSDNGYITTKVAVKNMVDANVVGASYVVDSKNKVLFAQDYLKICYGEDPSMGYPALMLGIKKGAPAPKKGSYKIPIIAKVELGDGIYESKQAVLTLNLTDLAPTATVSLKGNCNLLNFEDECMTGKVTLKNTSAKLEKVELTGEYKDMFWMECNPNSNELYLLAFAPNYRFDLKKAYKLGVNFYLSDNTVISWDGASKGQFITPKLVQKAPKLGMEPVKITVAKGKLFQAPISLYPYFITESGNIDVQIASAELQHSKYDKYFELDPFIDNCWMLFGNEDTFVDLKPQTINLTLNVHFVWEAINSKPTPVKVTVVIK